MIKVQGRELLTYCLYFCTVTVDHSRDHLNKCPIITLVSPLRNRVRFATHPWLHYYQTFSKDSRLIKNFLLLFLQSVRLCSIRSVSSRFPLESNYRGITYNDLKIVRFTPISFPYPPSPKPFSPPQSSRVRKRTGQFLETEGHPFPLECSSRFLHWTNQIKSF